jgi:hypothetical protein
MRALALFFVVVCASVARADEASSDAPLPAEGPRNAVTVSLVAPIGRGVSMSYERAFVGSKLGLSAISGMRFADGGDFRTRGYGLGAELRWYALGRAAFRPLATRAMVGFFLYGRATWTLTTLREAEGRDLVGRSHRLGLYGGLGYRFAFGPAIELTPSLGFGLHTDVVQGLASGTSPTATFSMTMGWLFERNHQ